jgi:hypothetical protein
MLGLTDAFLHQRVDLDRYDRWRERLCDEAASLGHRDRADQVEVEEGALVKKPQHEATIKNVQDYR